MGHATHFLDRLSRLKPAQVDFAFELYRNTLLSRTVAARFVPEGAERIALCLEDGERGPYIVLARDGGFVTVLGRGMSPTGLSVVPRAKLDGLQAVHDALQGAQARALAERFRESRYNALLYESGHRLTQEGFDSLCEFRGPLLAHHMTRTVKGYKNIAEVRSSLIGRLPRRMSPPRGELRDDLAAWWQRLHAYQHRAVLVAMDPHLVDAFLDGSADLVYTDAATFMMGMGTYGGLLRGLWLAAETAPWSLDSHLENLETARIGEDVKHASYAVAAAAGSHLPRRGEIIERLERLVQERGPADDRPSLRRLRSIASNVMLTAIRNSEASRLVFERHLRKVHELVQGRPAHDLSYEELIGFACGLPETYSQWHDRLELATVATQAVAGLPARALYPPQASAPVSQSWQTDAACAADLLHTDDGPQKVPIRRETRTGRNDPCPCGSGRKFKKCCLRAA